jgi:hypothetical protein
MRIHPGLFACGVTVALLVPAALVHLEAGPAQRARLFAPATRTVRIDGVDVKIALDRHVADRGDTVQLRLTAAHPVEAGIVVFGSTGSEAARNPSPPHGVAYQNVKLVPDGRGAAASVPITLKGAQHAGLDPFEHYAIFVTSKPAAARLRALRESARATGGGEELGDEGTWRLSQINSHVRGTTQPFDDPQDARLFVTGGAAVIDAHTRSAVKGLAVTLPERAVAGSPFEVVVDVTNATKRHQKDVTVELLWPPMDDAYELHGYQGLKVDALDVKVGEQQIELAPGETRRVSFEITAAHAGLLGIGARAWSPDQEFYDLLHEGTFDAIDVAPSEGAVVATSR